MIKVENLSYSVPQKDLYHNISFTLEDGKHCAMIGSNGTGKSMLVSMIMEPEEFLYDGKLEIDPDCRIGYVSQFSQPVKDTSITVFDYLSQRFVELQNQINVICEKMATEEDLEPIYEQYQLVLDEFNAVDGDNYENNIKKQLKTANLESYQDQAIANLSGGEFKLVQIMKEMIVQPNLLIMDEPDVFLDFANLEGLKNLINTYKGTMLVVTHSRFLLNNCFNKILHLENMDIQEFDGTYEEYNFTLLQTKIELKELSVKDDEEIERNKKLVEKLTRDSANFANASLGRALHARKSIVERLEARRIKAPFVALRQPQIELSTTNVLTDQTVIKVDDDSISFDDLLLEHVSFEIGANEKVAIVGPNGTGKTTLLRRIYDHSDSAVTIGDQVEMDFLSQLQMEMFDVDDKVSDIFYKLGYQTDEAVRAYLEKYCFTEDIVSSKVSKLSGGERNLIQLAVMEAGNANVLLLDEPTSHLDTYSQIELEKAISNYNGAILMVSHDFYTIANCMDYVLLIEDKTLRKVSIRKFRKMIYANHYDKDYIELEQKKKELETRIANALKNSDVELAKTLSDQLEPMIQSKK